MQGAAPQDFSRVLSSMCTVPHPAAREAAEQFLVTNPGDPATYQAVADLERRAVAKLGEVVGLDDPHGYIAGGGTEANIQAVRSARNLADSAAPNVVAPESAHFSFEKAAELLGVELRLVPVDEEYRADPAAMRRQTDDDTVLVVGVAGSTEYGRVDPIPALADLARDADARLHVDAAFGGFLLPFADAAWNFGDAGVDTMTIDPHKMGRAVIPAGGFVARDRTALDALSVNTPYLESTGQATLTGTRSGAGVASALAALRVLWPDGYREQFERLQSLAEWLAAALRERGFDVVEPSLPLVTATVPADLFRALRDEGWRIARTSDGKLRVVCMPHVTEEILAAFLADLDECAAAR